MDISNLDLLALQTKIMQADPVTQGFCQALKQEMIDIANNSNLLLIYSRLEEINEDLLDVLSYQFHVDFYDVSLPVEKKRELIKNALKWHKTKGTPAAVEEVVSAAFDESWVDEWFNYGGEPYMFKIRTTDRVTNEVVVSNIIKAVDSVKNIRSHLDKFVIQRDNNIEKYFGGAVYISTTLTIKSEEV